MHGLEILYVFEMLVDSLDIDLCPSHPGSKLRRTRDQHEKPEHPEHHDCLSAVGDIAPATDGSILALETNAVGVGRQFLPFEESEDEAHMHRSRVTRQLRSEEEEDTGNCCIFSLVRRGRDAVVLLKGL